MTWPSLPARNLNRSELESLVDAFALDAQRWRDLVDFSDEKRVFVSLHRDEFVDVWLLCWTRLNDTGWHDHDISSGAVRVIVGALSESSPRIGDGRRSEPSAPKSASRSDPITSIDSPARRTTPSRSTPTRRHCGVSGSTPSTTTA